MIFSIILAASCAPTEFINRTELDWNDFDMGHYSVAQKRCGEIYKKSKCVVKFIKRSERDFSVICGAAK